MNEVEVFIQGFLKRAVMSIVLLALVVGSTAVVLLSGRCSGQDWAPAQEAPVYDLRQHPTSQLGLVRAGGDLPPDWNLDVWVNPPTTTAGERPKRKPSFTLPPGGSKEWKLFYLKGVVSVYAEAWIWDGDRRILVARTTPIQEELEIMDRSGYGWVATLQLADFGITRFHNSWRWYDLHRHGGYR